ncbi:MAG: sulfotransferase [Novosphingobium sp.]|nr:sulfotransferase [Novosphingobium sp.]MCB2076911.1 sulfotransferase [Novosphingobium sp.]
MLDVKAIIAEAEEKVGIDDPETSVSRNLEILLDSLNRDGQLSEESEAMAHQGFVGRAVDRIEGLKWMQEYPEIAEEVIDRPVFLTGLPRSGTTYFQYLFDRDRRFRLIRTWEAIMPNPPPGFDPESVTRRKEIEAEFNAKIAPKIEGFDALHLIDEDGPQECHVFMEQGVAAAGFFNLYDVPDFFDFLMSDLDLKVAYEVHKRQLQLLQWKLPRPHWALKYPNHVIAMEQILQVYPDARFVMTHRDPAQILASISKMSFTLRTARQAGAVDPHRVGRQMLGFIRRHIDRIMDFCTGPNADRVTHVDYYRLADDPANLLSEIHAGIGIDTPDDVRESIAGWRRENPKGKRGANKYTLEQFGIDEDEARELYSDYSRHFDIPSEAEGTAATA